MKVPVRTLLAGIAVLAFSGLLLLLTWQFVLLVFFLAGLGWAVWKAGSFNRQPEVSENPRFRRTRERAPSKRRKAMRRGNVYQFPARQTSKGPEAADQ